MHPGGWARGSGAVFNIDSKHGRSSMYFLIAVVSTINRPSSNLPVGCPAKQPHRGEAEREDWRDNHARYISLKQNRSSMYTTNDLVLQLPNTLFPLWMPHTCRTITCESDLKVSRFPSAQTREGCVFVELPCMSSATNANVHVNWLSDRGQGRLGELNKNRTE